MLFLDSSAGKLVATLLDWGNVDAAAARVESALALSDRREAFSLLALATVLRLDFDEARGCVTDGSDDRGIDAVYLDERYGVRTIHLFQFKYHASYSRSNRNFPSNEVDKVLSFINDCFEQVDNFLVTCNDLLRQKVLDIWEFVRGGYCEVVVHLCSNGGKLQPDQQARFISSLERFKFFSLIETDLERFSDALSRRSSSNREIELNIVEDQVFERSDGNLRAIIGTVKGEAFIETLKDPANPNQLDPDLFEENVRVYLGEQNDINRRIFDTAVSKDASLFWYYNNGITIVCDRFSYQPGFKNTPLKLKNPQIVNGGQTSHALFQASKSEFNAVDKVRLLVRIIETQDTTIYAKVAEATNSQTPIRSRDLRSNDPVLVKLETSLRSYDWYLDRKRDQHATIPTTQRIDALKLGQFWLAYVMGEPDKAKTASDRIFGEYFPLVFDPAEMDANRVVAVWRIYAALEQNRRSQIEEARKAANQRSSQPSETSWAVEGLYHFAFAVRRLADNENIDIFDFEKVEPLLADAQTRIAKFVLDQPGVSYYRLFRSAATKRNLVARALDNQQLVLEL
jgi:hypothetical protein